MKVTGKLEVCEDCALGKAKQKKIPKIAESKSKKAGDTIMFDVSSFKHKSYRGAKPWLAIVDDHTDMCWSKVLKKK